MTYIIMILLCFIIILTVGFLNYYLRRHSASKISVAWVDPCNVEQIGGISTHIIVKGKGDPLILIHGSQMNLYDWRYNIDYFSKFFKVYALDMVGCGFSGKPKVDYSPDYFADFIEKVLDHYNISKASFIASSWGGGHVLHFALKHPERVNRLVLSSPCGIPHQMNFIDTVLSLPIISSLLMLFTTKSLVKSQLNKAFEKKSLMSDDLINAVYLPLLSKGCIHSTVNSYRNADFTFVRENLGRLKVPVLIIWGALDRIHPQWMMDEMTAKIEGCTLYIIPDAGHMPHEESPAEFNMKAYRYLVH